MKKLSILTVFFLILIVSDGAFAQTPTPTPTPFALSPLYKIPYTARLVGDGSPLYADTLNVETTRLHGDLAGFWTLFQVSHNVDGTLKVSAIPTPTPAPTATPAPTPTPFQWVTPNLEIETLALGDPAPTPVLSSSALVFGRHGYMGQNASLNIVLNGEEKQIAAMTYDGVSRYYLPEANLPDGAMMQSSYDVVPTGTPSNVVKWAEKLRNMSTSEELTESDVAAKIKGRESQRLPTYENDTLISQNGMSSFYTKAEGGDQVLYVRLNIGGVDYDVRVATSATPTPTATPTP